MTDSLDYWFLYTYPLAKELARILTPLAGKTESSVKGSSDFARRVHEMDLHIEPIRGQDGKL